MYCCVDTLRRAVSRNEAVSVQVKKAADVVTPLLGQRSVLCLANQPSHRLTSGQYQHADLTSHGHCLICFGSDRQVHYRREGREGARAEDDRKEWREVIQAAAQEVPVKSHLR